ncbi:transposable element Tcb1 transposase [Trichonephila clavipes]|nr:transposable element Tcb1 transposase [Trichonephila clavipes]
MATTCSNALDSMNTRLMTPSVGTRELDHPIFKCDKDGFTSNPLSCKSYIKCSHHRRYLMPCKEGYHFSNETGQCEPACDAHCDQSLAFDQVSEFDRGRIVAYRDCGLSFIEIGIRVGRNQTTVMQICDRWMQEGTTDRRGRSHPPQCITSREDRQIVRMAVTDHSVTSRIVAQHIESVTHHSVSARTIRHRLQQSGLSTRRPLLGLPLSQNHRRLRRQWCDERRMWVAEWNEVVFTDESRICLQHHDGRIRVWRHRGERMLNSCVMQRHTDPALGIIVWGGIGYHSRTSLVRITGTFKHPALHPEVLEPVVLPYLQGLATAIFQQDNA